MNQQLPLIDGVPVKGDVRSAPMAAIPCTERGAILSECGRYRYRLWRVWDDALPRCMWVMLNPSTADADYDDMTIRRCFDFSRAGGYGGFHVLNLFAYRTPHPSALRNADDPIGPENDAHLRAIDAEGTDMICAWGASGPWRDRDLAVLRLVRRCRWLCLGVTKDGHPRHPLYVPTAQAMGAFHPRQEARR